MPPAGAGRRRIIPTHHYRPAMNKATRSVTRIAIVTALLLAGSAAHAEVYKWIDADGKTQFSDKPPPDQKNVKQLDLKDSKVSPDPEPATTTPPPPSPTTARPSSSAARIATRNTAPPPGACCPKPGRSARKSRFPKVGVPCGPAASPTPGDAAWAASWLDYIG